ncbi:hypothetical protein LJC52_01965 [Bacteroidales bacterium OttesenSCG-928-A17]|nr:hypothetical protein [Bacteroidales bacterium OttesenSCG-928-A17]
MKHYTFLFLLTAILLPFSSFAQENKLDFKFYGFLRADVCYDSRVSVVGNEGLFFLYPQDVNLDANGKDLNSQASLGLYSFNARPGVEISGLHVFGADVVGKMEADFAGFGGQYGNSSILRIRLAYMKMLWDKSSLLIGQDWHPFFGPVTPGQISLSTGAPFNPFNRSPQLRYNYAINDKLSVSAAALYQFQFNSTGVDGKTTAYQKYALMPEWVGMVNYQTKSFTAGVGANLLTLKPRRTSSWNNATYKVDESLYSSAFTAYLKYTDNMFSVGAKTIYGSNMTHLSMIGGYGVKNQNSETGEQEYTNLKTSSSWINVSYGKKYLCNLLLGYAKNLGTEDPLLENSALYGEGLTIDDLSRVAASFSYNVPHFKLGIEYEFSHVNYGDKASLSWETGKMKNTHSVNNSRIIGIMVYFF